MLLEGLHIPVPTPFLADGRLHRARLAASVARYGRTPAAGLYILGPSAEPTLLSDAETEDVLATAAETAPPDKVLLAGIWRDGLASALSLAERSAALRYDAVVVPAPAILRPDRRSERLAWLRCFADRPPLPVVLLHVSTDEAAELAAHPTVIGLVTRDPVTRDPVTREPAAAIRALLEQTASVRREVTVTHVFAAVTARMRRAELLLPASALGASAAASRETAVVAAPPAAALRTRTRAVGFQVLASDSATMLDALAAGAVGVAPAFSAAAPQACYEVLAAWKDGDPALAEEKQERIRAAAAQVAELGPAAIKYGADLNAYSGGASRLPYLPLTGDQRAAIERSLQPLRS